MNELTAAADALRTVIRRTWWIPLVQGIAALVIGIRCSRVRHPLSWC